MNEIDYLLRGTVAFVIDGLKKHPNLPDLWATVQSFDLPSWALVRPTTQLLPHAMVMDSSVAAPWARTLFGEQLKLARQRRGKKRLEPQSASAWQSPQERLPMPLVAPLLAW
jgi:hypothetical protein